MIKSGGTGGIKVLRTVDKGIKILDEEERKKSNSNSVSGSIAFKIYGNYGFPVDLTDDVFKNKNKKIDMNKIETEMKA